MNRSNQRTSSRLGAWLRLLTLGYATAAALIGTARADDSEIYISTSSVPPNIMLILDTSGSMQGRVSTQEPYDPRRDYVAEATGACAGISGRVYYTTGYDQGVPPTCESLAWVSEANQRCQDAVGPLASSAGSFRGDRFAQWRTQGTNERRWRGLLSEGDIPASGVNAPIDCENDGAPYPDVNGRSSNNTPVYTNNNRDSYLRNNGGTLATLYSARYIAYFNQFSQYTYFGTRLEVMKQAATSLLNGVTNVNVGLMRYSANVSGATQTNPNGDGGGLVLQPVAPIADNKDQMISSINGLIAYGSTPLSETLYEAHQYFSGGRVDFGNTSRVCTASTPSADGTTTNCSGDINEFDSVASSRSDDNYRSPANQSCQKNYVVYLTDGQPTSDNKADRRIEGANGSGGLPDFRTTVTGGACSGSGPGRCLGALSEYMYNRDLRSDVDGTQNVTSFYIGFGDAFGGTDNPAFEYLEDAARRGGGQAYQAGDLSQLSRVFTDIFANITEGSSTLTAPTVAVNAFNRTQTLDDLYISLFMPTAQLHWPGNLKKYRIVEGKLKAKGNRDAIDSDGAFDEQFSDYWSETGGDGPDILKGGAAMKIPAPADRNLYTYLGNNPGTPTGVGLRGNGQAAVHVDNALLTPALLGTDTSNPERDKLINWARGADVDDVVERSDQRNAMGDPMHSQPAVVIYDGDPVAQTYNAVVFTATNDGYVHAIATTERQTDNAADGRELWAFIPKEMLPGLKPLYLNENIANKNYMIDGDLRVLKYDVDGDGNVEPADNDRVLLFFSTGRNSSISRYYALDVTDKNAPRFLWSIGPETLDGLGEAWSRPAITRVNISEGQQNTQKLVLVFGGGYDSVEEGYSYVPETSVGNRVYMVDALYGRVLWTAGDEGTDLELERMKHSIPSGVNVVDLDGDGFGDRMYVGDMAAQLWRFDIFNGRTRSELVTGGVIASLGAKDAQTVSRANTRRFYNTPDTALLQVGNARPFINVAIGSGYRGHPLSTDNQDRFYAIRDQAPFAMFTQEQYNTYDIVTEADLEDITEDLNPNLPANIRGWMLQLNFPQYQGEKVLAPATTLDNILMFTTYLPDEDNGASCSPAQGVNRAYFLNALDGSAAIYIRDGETEDDEGGENGGGGETRIPQDRWEEAGSNGIAPGVTTLFPGENKVTCLAGVKVLNACKDFGSRIKTYWRQSNAN
ncbi:hypothetical protein JM946_10375 [Steroidobacter sp. S1-65]|uniref:PilY1 beta-propeller domain-containing protein n=1 Tax=Steroidobacter gossypii TaxID=2805490 RepID=A0ABS1WW15_9GAMM|nr:PilC/PilY family type IV pilus protein [Steroidobacter gossypii]MBM0105159.1 hypothetical protein [Steroidobacter gossypii]